MLDQAAMEGLKISVKMEELKGYLEKTIVRMGGDVAQYVQIYMTDGKIDDDHCSAYIASKAARIAECVNKCYEIIGILDDIKGYVDRPVEELYERIFRNVTVK